MKSTTMDYEFLKVKVGKKVTGTYNEHTIYVPICNIEYITPPTQSQIYSVKLKSDITENDCTYSAVISAETLKKFLLNP